LPVDAPPRVRVCALVVPRVPVAVREVALLFAPDMEAVGVPELTLRKPNLALTVAVPPSKRSSVEILCVIAPLVSSNGEPPLTTGRIPETSVPLFRFTREVERVPLEEVWTMPTELRPENWIVPLEIIPVAAVMLPAELTWN